MFISSSILFKLAVAMALGMSLGLERELRKKPLGLKTATVISLASCLLTVVSIESAYSFPAESGAEIRMDPLRLAAQIVSGIGFLGAGVIMVQGGITITGLTTAALIWAASGLGIAVGAGFWKEATITMILLLISIEFLPGIVKRIGPMRLKEKEISVTLIAKPGYNVDEIHKKVKDKKIYVQKLKISDLKTGEARLEYIISTQKKTHNTFMYNEFKTIDGVEKVDIETF